MIGLSTLSMNLGLLLAGGTTAQYSAIAADIQIGLADKMPVHDIVQRITTAFQDIGPQEDNADYVTVHSLLQRIIAGGRAPDLSESRLTKQLHLAVDFISMSEQIALLSMPPSETEQEAGDTLPPSAADSAEPSTVSEPVQEDDVAFISDIDDPNRKLFLTEVLQIEPGPWPSDAPPLSSLGPNEVSDSIRLDEDLWGSSTPLNESLVRKCQKLLCNTFTVKKNPGPMPDEAWAKNIDLVATLMTPKKEWGLWRLNLNVKFILEVADSMHLPMVTLGRDHEAYKAISDKEIGISVNYQGEIVLEDHAVRIYMAIVEDESIRGAFSRREFGNLEIILSAEGIALKMQDKMFSLNPDNFLKAIRNGMTEKRAGGTNPVSTLASSTHPTKSTLRSS